MLFNCIYEKGECIMDVYQKRFLKTSKSLPLMFSCEISNLSQTAVLKYTQRRLFLFCLLFKGEIIDKNYFCVHHKTGPKGNQHFKLLFFTINLHFVTSNQISVSRKLNLTVRSSICVVVLPLEMQRGLKQTKVHHTFFYAVWKETTHKPLKVAAAKTLFSSAYAIGTTCDLLQWIFLFHVNWEHFFS